MSKQVMIGMLAGAQANDANVAVAPTKVAGKVIRLSSGKVIRIRSVEDEIDEALANGHCTFLELYRIVCGITQRSGLSAPAYVFKDVVDGLHNALLDCIGDGDPDYDTEWEYLPDVSWVYPDTDDDDLYERLYTENVEALFDCLECVECVLTISKAATEFLVKHTNEVVFYNKRTGKGAWVIPFFNMPWSCVDVVLQ